MRCWMATVVTDGVKDQLQASTRGAISSCGLATYPDARPMSYPLRPAVRGRDRCELRPSERHYDEHLPHRALAQAAPCPPSATAPSSSFMTSEGVERGSGTRLRTAISLRLRVAGWQEEPDRSRWVPDLRGDVGHRTALRPSTPRRAEEEP